MPAKKCTVNPETDLLQKLTDPVKLRKKAHKKQTAKAIRARQICSLHKQYANQHYNLALNQQTYEHLRLYICRPNHITKEVLTEVIRNKTPPEFTSPTAEVDPNNSLAVVLQFIKCAQFCQAWLNKELVNIGWTENMTNYEPLSVSHSSPELIKATLECFKMACKQMILVIDYETTILANNTQK